MSRGSNSPDRTPRFTFPNDPNLFLVQGAQGDFNDTSPDGSGYGTAPAVEQNQTYFAFFDAIGGTGPEIIDQTAYFIKYLIDTEGNIANPDPNTPALYNLIDNFELGKQASVKLIGGGPEQSANPNDDTLVGDHKITGIGRISPILITETGSSIGAYEPTMSFINYPSSYGASGTPDYEFKAYLSTTQTIPTPTTAPEPRLELSSVIQPNIQYTSSNPYYEYNFDSDTSTYANKVNFKSSGSISGSWKASTAIGTTADVYIRIWKNYPSNIIGQTVRTIYKGTPGISYTFSFAVETGYLDFVIGDEIYFDVACTSTKLDSISLLNNTYGQAVQQVPILDRNVTASYWSVGSWLTGSNITVLTASNQLASVHSPSYIQSASAAVYSASFSQINLPFQVQSGDYIRFEYNIDKVYNITDVNETNGLYLTVVPPIPTGSQLNHFVLYRIVNDGSYVILDVKKQYSGNSFSGILQPKYTSQTLQDNYSNIIQKLTAEGTIS
jgi:hypothetical protein